MKSCESQTDDGCADAHGHRILVYKNHDLIDEIEEGFHNYEKCFATEQDDEFAFHLGGTNGVSMNTSSCRSYT